MAAYSACIPIKAMLWNIKKFHDVFLPAPLMEIIEVAYKELKSFQEFAERLDSRSRKRMSASLERTAEAISEFSGVFESHFEKLWDDNLKKINDGDQFPMVLQDLRRDTESFIETLKKTKEEEYCYYYPEDEEVDSSSAGNKMVGLRDQFSQLKQQLVYGEDPVISLVGMAGIGKTTLARKIFQDFDIMEIWKCRAWVTVGKEFKLKEVRESILDQVDPQMYEMATRGDKGMTGEYLEKFLERNQTLIVLDDVWTEDALHFLMNSFSNTNLVKVLLTSRYQDFAKNCIFSSYILLVRLLDEKESWDLLRVQVFSEESCPPQLEDPGEKIAEKCDGLPLTIVTVANLLSKAGKTQESLWIEVATRKRHQLLTEAYDEISKILYPIYESLHLDHYGWCFLYMGVFRQKYKIPRSKLINLWIAEGLVLQSFIDTREESAVKYIQRLALCSLVMVYQKSSSLTPYKDDRRTKICGLHSSWWHFCQREARKTKFFHVLDCPKDGLEKGIKGQSRLSIHNNVLFARKDVYNSIEENCASTAQSLLCFGPYHRYQVPICFGLKLLQRLDALNVRFYEFPLEVLELVELRYLALTCNGKLPSSISKLLHLLFFIVRQCSHINSQGALTYLPTEIWDIKYIQHLQIMGTDLPDSGHTKLLYLKTLLDVSADGCTKRSLERIPNLTKLGIRIELRNDDSAEPLRCFDHISRLKKLESLKCVVVNPKCKAEVVAPPAPLSIFPSNLKKLNLNGLSYPWEEMSKIAPLPNLEVLKLRCNAFEGPKWEIEKDGFPNLRFLLIEDLDLVQLKGGRGSFKCLSILRIKHCYKLEKLDLGRCELLSDIDVVNSNPFVEKEVKEIAIKRTELPEHFRVHSSWNS